MRRCLLSISLCVILSACSVQNLARGGVLRSWVEQNIPAPTPEKSSAAQVGRVDVFVDFASANLSGLLYYRLTGDGVVGSMVNEFGIRMFDLRIDRKGCRVDNLPDKLDKWYIRRTLQQDLLFMFYSRGDVPDDGHRRLTETDNMLIMENLRRGIIYRFVMSDNWK